MSTVNLDYRSLVHHFENGVWLYGCECIKEIYNDVIETINKSEFVERETIKVNFFARFVRSIIRIFAPLL